SAPEEWRDANDAAPVLARKGKVSCGPTYCVYGIRVEPARFERRPPARIRPDDAVGGHRIGFADRRPRAGDGFPGRQSVGGKVGYGLEREVCGAVVDDGEGATRDRSAAHHQLLGRLIEREKAEARIAREPAGGAENARGGADLIGGQWRERMRI